MNLKDDFINEISGVFQVDKAVVENRKSTVAVNEMGGIAGALARALEERRKNMRDSEGTVILFLSEKFNL